MVILILSLEQLVLRLPLDLKKLLLNYHLVNIRNNNDIQLIKNIYEDISIRIFISAKFNKYLWLDNPLQFDIMRNVKNEIIFRESVAFELSLNNFEMFIDIVKNHKIINPIKCIFYLCQTGIGYISSTDQLNQISLTTILAKSFYYGYYYTKNHSIMINFNPTILLDMLQELKEEIISTKISTPIATPVSTPTLILININLQRNKITIRSKSNTKIINFKRLPKYFPRSSYEGRPMKYVSYADVKKIVKKIKGRNFDNIIENKPYIYFKNHTNSCVKNHFSLHIYVRQDTTKKNPYLI